MYKIQAGIDQEKDHLCTCAPVIVEFTPKGGPPGFIMTLKQVHYDEAI